MEESRAANIRLQVGHTSEFDPTLLAAARNLLDDVFDDMTDDDWDHSLGGVHAMAWDDTSIIGHASVVQRRLIHGGQALRTGYVEGVAVALAWQGRGVGALLMSPLEQIIMRAYDLGALGASDAAIGFYVHRGWVKWMGHTSALTPTGVVRTPDEDDSTFVWRASHPIDITGELTCDWRGGDVW